MVAGLAMLSQVATAQQNHQWIDPGGGNFHNASNWDLGVPSPSDAAIFNLDATYNVDLAFNHDIRFLRVDDGDVTLRGAQAIDGGVILRAGNLTFTESVSVNSTNDLQVGATANSHLTFSANASYATTARAFIGQSSALSRLTLNNATMVIDRDFNVFDTATVDVLQDASLSTFSTRIGQAGGGSGVARINVDGVGASLTTSATINVGRNAEGRLDVLNGGSATTSSMIVGDASGVDGTVNLRGFGSMLASPVTIVGDQGNGLVNVTDGASLTGLNGFLGREIGGQGNVLVSGADSSWNLAIGLTVGDQGTGSLVIQDSGSVTTGSTTSINGTSSVSIDGGSLATAGLSNSGQLLALGGTANVSGDVDILSTGIIYAGTQAELILADDVFHNGIEVFTEQGSSIRFQGDVQGSGDYTGQGDIFFGGQFQPGNGPGMVDVLQIESDAFFENGSTLMIELAGTDSGDFDQLQLARDLTIAGALDVALVGSFELLAGQEFVIATIDQQRFGGFVGLGEGDLVGNFGGHDLFISYMAGDGNDIALSVAGIPEPGCCCVIVCLSGAILLRRKGANFGR